VHDLKATPHSLGMDCGDVGDLDGDLRPGRLRTTPTTGSRR
jgi:hypothetical protein